MQIIQHPLNLRIANIAPVQKRQQVQQCQHRDQTQVHLAEDALLHLRRESRGRVSHRANWAGSNIFVLERGRTGLFEISVVERHRANGLDSQVESSQGPASRP